MKTNLFIAGDSTAASYPSDQSPMAGWGQMLPLLLSEQIIVHNEATCGRSSKSFIQEGRLQRIEHQLKENDYLFIQFGHNDEKPEGTEPFSTFLEYLTQYITCARSKGAIPVLLTPVQRRHFDENGILQQTHGDYPEAMIQLANQLDVPLINIMLKTEKLYQTLGAEKSKELFVWLEPNEHLNYPEGLRDNTHFNEYGAKKIAELVIEGIIELDLPLENFLVNKTKI